MSFSLLCMIFLLASAGVLIFSIASGVAVYKKRRSKADNVLHKSRFVFTPFQIFLVGFFISATLLFFPINYTEVFSYDTGVGRIFNSVFLSVHNSFQVFLLEGDWAGLQAVLCDFTRINSTVGSVYVCYALVFFVVAPLLTAGFVLSFFKNISASIRYRLKRSKEIYYLSALNERSFALAINIIKERGRFHPAILFFNVDDESEDKDGDLIQEVKALGAICFKKDITEIGYKAHKRKLRRKLYFISDDEDQNVKQALTLVRYFRQNSRLNRYSNEFYVFATSVGSEALLDSTDNGNLKVRRINENKNLVIKTLLDYPIFGSYIDGKTRKLNILIVGLGQYGLEFLKALCWSGQMIGYTLHVNVIDEREDVAKIVEHIAPELMAKNGKKEVGEPYYKIKFYGGVDVASPEYRRALKKIGEVTTAYLTLGEDRLNMETAIATSMEYQRLNINGGWRVPKLYTVVYSTVKSQTVMDNGGLKSIDDKTYPIQLIGDRTERYSLDTIELPILEDEARACHLQWSNTEEAKAEANQKFEKYEYYRRASTGEAVHKHLRRLCGVVESKGYREDQIMALEHKRWNAYMRSEGFVVAPKDKGKYKDFIAKAHFDLVPTYVLSDKEYEKDILVAREKSKE